MGCHVVCKCIIDTVVFIESSLVGMGSCSQQRGEERFAEASFAGGGSVETSVRKETVSQVLYAQAYRQLRKLAQFIPA